jgi:hypothetical protein
MKPLEPNPLVARTLRAQRAIRTARELARAPMPTLRQSVAYLMSTTGVADDTVSAGHHLEVLGLHADERAVYFAETMRDDHGDDVPLVYRMHLRGAHAGHLIPLASWYDEAALPDLPDRIAAVTARLAPLPAIDPEAWMLTTRVIQHRAIRVVSSTLPVRKFALQLTVEPGDAAGPPTRAVVTAYLRPRASLDAAWAVPGADLAVVRVTYVGVPSGVGLPKQTAMLVPYRADGAGIAREPVASPGERG